MPTSPIAHDLEFVRLERPSDDVLVAVMNRPEVMNAMNAGMVGDLRAVVDAMPDDPARVLVITGAGERAFSAGADIQEMLDMSQADAFRSLHRGVALTRAIERCPKVVIAAVNGAALGGGMEIALACDLRTANPEAKLGTPEVSIGIFPGWGGTVRLPRLVPAAVAAEILLTGTAIRGDRAAELGLVNRCGEDALALAMELAEAVLRSAPLAQQQAKLVMTRTVDMAIDDAMSFENEAWMRTFFSADRQEGHRAFLERRRPVWTSS